MLKLLKIWKIDRDLKIKYTSLRLCDAFLSESLLLLMMKALIALVIRLSLTFTRRPDKVRMNNQCTGKYRY